MKFSALYKNQIFSFLLFSIFYFLFSASLSVPTAFAEQVNQNSFTSPNTNPDVPNNLHTYTQNVVIEILSAATCQLAGIDPVNPNAQCLGVDQKTGKIGFVDPTNGAGGGGAIGIMGNMISMLYTFPIHTGDYFHYLAQNFGITKKAYAQGTGFEGLKPLISVWTAFRNIVYLIFTIVFVVIGFAIMFRIKIDPRTVMSIQNQIPKIIIGILLVTFSYAISGFLIDMMYTSIYLTGNVLTSASGQSAAVVTGVIQSDNPFSAASQTVDLKDVTWEPAKTVGEFISPIFDNPGGRIVMGIAGGFIASKIRTGTAHVGETATKIAKPVVSVAGWALAPFTGGASVVVSAGINKGLTTLGDFFAKEVGKPASIASDITTQKVSPNPQAIIDSAGGIIGFVAGYLLTKEIVSGLISLIAFLIIAIAVLWSLFRLWFILILSYIYILIAVVLAPFWIAGGLIPGSPINFTGWLRHILSYLAVFPLTIALFLLGKVFIDAFGTKQTGFVPPMISNPAGDAIGAIIGLGIILLTPNVLKMTQAALKAPKVEVGTPMQAIGVSTGILQAPFKPLIAGATFLGGQKLAHKFIPGLRERERPEAAR